MKMEKAVLHLWKRMTKEARALRARGLTYEKIEIAMHLRPNNGMTAYRLVHDLYSRVPKALLGA